MIRPKPTEKSGDLAVENAVHETNEDTEEKKEDGKSRRVEGVAMNSHSHVAMNQIDI